MPHIKPTILPTSIKHCYLCGSFPSHDDVLTHRNLFYLQITILLDLNWKS